MKHYCMPPLTLSGLGIVKWEGSFFASLARNCKQNVIQASSPLTKKQNFKFLKKYFENFKIPITHKNWLLKFGFAYSLAQILEPKLLVHEILKFVRHLFDLIKKFANFKILPACLSKLLNLGIAMLATKFKSVICSLINFKIWVKFTCKN